MLSLRTFVASISLLGLLPSLSLAQVQTTPRPQSLQGEKVLDADPFDVSTGIYSREYTDLFIPDSIPIKFVRTLRTGDNRSRAFGFGGMTSYDMFIIGDTEKLTWVALVFADGTQARFTRISPGTIFNAVFEDQTDPSEFRGARISWNRQGNWDVKLQDGTLYKVQACNANSTPGQCAVTSIQNAAGERLNIQRDPKGNIVRITSPHGHFANVTTDSQGRITHLVSDDGQWVDYSYDEKGCLARAVNSRRDRQTFRYDGRRNMVYVHEKGPEGRDGEGPYDFEIHNRYDVQNRFAGQVISTGQIFSVEYRTYPKGTIRQTNVKDGQTLARHFFDENGWMTKEDLQLGTRSLWQLDYLRNPAAHEVLDLTLTCPTGKYRLPPGDAGKIMLMGDARKQFLWQTCRQFARSAAQLKPATQH